MMITNLRGGRRLAISDIHGCAKTFKELINQIQLQKDDNLFILGDMINRGKHSKKVIKTILSLNKSGYNILALRGNHEQFIIAELSKSNINEFYSFCSQTGSKWLFHKGSMMLKEKYISFFKTLPYYYNLGDRLLSHAGFDLSKEDIFENSFAMLCQRTFTNTNSIPTNIKIIHGHTPISLDKIQRSIQNNNSIINIDNGCSYNSQHNKKGNLVCLNLDTFELHIQKNIED